MDTDFRRVGENSCKAADLQTYSKYLHNPQPTLGIHKLCSLFNITNGHRITKENWQKRIKLEGQLLKTLLKIITEIISQKR